MSDSLDFVTTEELIEELVKRLDYGAFVGLKILTGGESEEGEHQIYRRWLGNVHTAVGLIEDLKHTMLDDYHQRSAEA